MHPFTDKIAILVRFVDFFVFYYMDYFLAGYLYFHEFLYSLFFNRFIEDYTMIPSFYKDIG